MNTSLNVISGGMIIIYGPSLLPFCIKGDPSPSFRHGPRYNIANIHTLLFFSPGLDDRELQWHFR